MSVIYISFSSFLSFRLCQRCRQPHNNQNQRREAQTHTAQANTKQNINSSQLLPAWPFFKQFAAESIPWLLASSKNIFLVLNQRNNNASQNGSCVVIITVTNLFGGQRKIRSRVRLSPLAPCSYRIRYDVISIKKLGGAPPPPPPKREGNLIKLWCSSFHGNFYLMSEYRV